MITCREDGHDNDDNDDTDAGHLVHVQLKAGVEAGAVQLVLEVVPHPGEDLHHPLRLVVVRGVGEQRPGLHHHHPVARQAGEWHLYKC